MTPSLVASAIPAAFCILLMLSAGCTGASEAPPVIPAPETTRPHTLPTPTPEIIYVYVTVTVTPPPPTPVPTPTKDKTALADLPLYNVWRYQSVSKDDGSFRYGPVTALLIHLGKAPDEKSYQLYYQGGRKWREDLETLIDNTKNAAPAVRSAGLTGAITNYTTFLTVQNESIRTLDRVMTDWQFGEAGRVTNGIVVNITNATNTLDRQVAVLV